jgi:hypothetical protein
LAQIGTSAKFFVERSLSVIMESEGKRRDWQTIAQELGKETSPERIAALVLELQEAMERANPYSKYEIDPQRKTA